MIKFSPQIALYTPALAEMAGCKYEKFLSPGGKVLSSRSSAVR